jgi:hypothetical protein
MLPTTLGRISGVVVRHLRCRLRLPAWHRIQFRQGSRQRVHRSLNLVVAHIRIDGGGGQRVPHLPRPKRFLPKKPPTSGRVPVLWSCSGCQDGCMFCVYALYHIRLQRLTKQLGAQMTEESGTPTPPVTIEYDWVHQRAATDEGVWDAHGDKNGPGVNELLGD